MPRNAAFWRNLAIVGLVHVAVLVGLTRWSGGARKPLSTDVVWMDGGAFTPAALNTTQPSVSARTEAEPEPTVTEEPTVPPMEDPLTMRTPPEREPDEPTPTPQPSATPRPTPKPKPTATPTAKKLMAKASPAKKPAASAASSATKKITLRPTTKGGALHNESASRGSGSSAAVQAQLVTYARLLHDWFYREWSQPTGLPAGARYTLSVRVRIERDGRVSEFKLARSSGNVVVDESVENAGKRVTQVDPLPPELASAGHYDLNVNFELDAE
jgi:TonB family protein